MKRQRNKLHSTLSDKSKLSIEVGALLLVTRLRPLWKERKREVYLFILIQLSCINVCFFQPFFFLWEGLNKNKCINFETLGQPDCFISSFIVAKQELQPRALLCFRFFSKLCEQESWVTSKLVRNYNIYLVFAEDPLAFNGPFFDLYWRRLHRRDNGQTQTAHSRFNVSGYILDTGHTWVTLEPTGVLFPCKRGMTRKYWFKNT